MLVLGLSDTLISVIYMLAFQTILLCSKTAVLFFYLLPPYFEAVNTQEE